MTSTLSAKRQVSIPKKLCDQLQLEPGARIDWEAQNGKLLGHPLPKDIIRKLTGIYRDGPDLVGQLLADRKKDREISDRKLQRATVRKKRRSGKS